MTGRTPQLQDEFEALLRPVLKPALSLALSLAKRREDAEDLVQNAALRAFSSFERFERGTNFRAWFFRILTNLALHQHRDEARRPQTSTLDDLPEWSLWEEMKRSGAIGRGDDPASRLMSKLDAAQVRTALEALPPEFRVVCVLSLVEAWDYAQIAEVVGCPVGTVRSRLHRGRKKLQQELWQLAREQGVVSGEPKR